MKPIIAILPFFFAACATTAPSTYYRDGATARDLENESAQCRAQAAASPAAAQGLIFSELAILDACMQGKGWRSVRVDSIKR